MMNDSDLPAFRETFRRLANVLPRDRPKNLKIAEETTFKILRRYERKAVFAAALTLSETSKRFPAPAEWIEKIAEEERRLSNEKDAAERQRMLASHQRDDAQVADAIARADAAPSESQWGTTDAQNGLELLRRLRDQLRAQDGQKRCERQASLDAAVEAHQQQLAALPDEERRAREQAIADALRAAEEEETPGHRRIVRFRKRLPRQAQGHRTG